MQALATSSQHAIKYTKCSGNLNTTEPKNDIGTPISQTQLISKSIEYLVSPPPLNMPTTRVELCVLTKSISPIAINKFDAIAFDSAVIFGNITKKVSLNIIINAPSITPVSADNCKSHVPMYS